MTAIHEPDRGPHAPFTLGPGVRVVPLRTPTLPPATHTNCVVLGLDRVVLVDPASPYEDEQDELFAWLEAERSEVVAVWLTHHHADHIGGAEAIRTRFGVPILAHPATIARLEGTLRVDAPIFDGDHASDLHDLDLGVEVLARHTPGHARGHLAFRVEEPAVWVVGDLVAGQGTIVIDPPEGDMADYLHTLARLVEEGVGAVVPAHGPAILEGERLLLDTIAHRQRREEQLARALEARGTRGARPIDLVPGVYPEVPAVFHPLAARQVLAHFRKFEAEGRVLRPDGSTGAPGAPVYLSADMSGWTATLPVFRWVG